MKRSWSSPHCCTTTWSKPASAYSAIASMCCLASLRADRRARHRGAHADAFGRLRDRAQHGPDHRRLALARRPGVEVVGHGDEAEAGPLRLDRRLHEEVRPVLLGREVQAELHAGHWRFAIASASSVLLMFERRSMSRSLARS